MLSLVGLDRVDLKSMLGTTTAPPILQLDIRGAESPAAVIDRLLDDLAELALRRWPDWRQQPASQSGTLGSNWRRGAARFAASGRRPRFRRLSPEAELAHLMSTLEPFLLLGEVDPVDPVGADGAIATLEWCRRQRAAVIALLPAPPAPTNPWDRVLFGAEIFDVPESVNQRVLGAGSAAAPSSGACAMRWEKVAISLACSRARLRYNWARWG